MNLDFFGALKQLENEKGISIDYMLEKVSQALLTAYKKDFPNCNDNILIDINKEKKFIKLYVKKKIVDNVTDIWNEISLNDAKLISKKSSINGTINLEIKPKNFGRIAAGAAKMVIIQAIREAERGIILNEFSSKENEIISAIVSKIDPKNGNLILEISGKGEKIEAILSKNEQVKNEVFKEGNRIKIYVVEVKKNNKCPQVLISRTHPGLVKRLFELEVPEISNHIVEIKSIAREPGYRTKIAVSSNNNNVDPIGACVGTKGTRSKIIVDELQGEKIDIVKYSDNLKDFVAAALSPADIISVEEISHKFYKVIVCDEQLSLAIGKKGQNVRLSAKLTGCKIDIIPLSKV